MTTPNQQPQPGADTHQQLVRSCVSHHHACDCREQQFRELLALAQGTMEGWAHAEVLHEWHCRCEKLIGTAYPANTSDHRPPTSGEVVR